MKATYKREIGALLGRPAGWLYAFALLAVASAAAIVHNVRGGYADFSTVIAWCGYAYLAAAPLLASVVFFEEPDTRRLTRSLPLCPLGVTAGRYLAALTVHTLSCLALALYPLVLRLFCELPLATAYCQLIGFWALGCALPALCAPAALRSNLRVVAFVRGAALTAIVRFLPQLLSAFASLASASLLQALLALVAVALAFFLLFESLPGALLAALAFELPLALGGLSASLAACAQNALDECALWEHCAAFTRGLMDLRQLLFFLLATLLLMALAFAVYATQSVSERRPRS